MEELNPVENLRYIITGGPGSGKSSLVEALGHLGFAGFPEIARDLINQGMIPPIWADKPDSSRFFELILRQRIFCHQEIKAGEIGFYDRGIPDSLAYFKYQNLRPPSVLLEATETYRYNPVVFVLPPWREIFVNDSVRKETYEETKVLYGLAKEVYLSAGYDIIELPKATLERRVEIIRELCSAPQNDK